MERQELREMLLKKTQEGPVDQWINRMGPVAKVLDFDLADICWQGAPRIVADGVAQYAINKGKGKELFKMCSS